MESIFPNIIETMELRGIGRAEVAEHLGLNQMALYRRLRGITEWKLCEAIQLCQLLECDDIKWLFVRLHSN